jgi:hypothetical protein
MRLSELEPFFLKFVDESHFAKVEKVTEADGIMFLCPVCWKANGGAQGTHVVLCWTPKVPREIEPKPGRWNFQGTGVEDLTFVASPPSVQLQGGCNAHFRVENGEIVPA